MARYVERPEMDKILSLCKRRGFVFQSSEIYGRQSRVATQAMGVKERHGESVGSVRLTETEEMIYLSAYLSL